MRGARAPSPPLTLLAGCGGGDDEAVKTLTIAVNAPFSRSPYVGETIGVELGASRAGVIETKEGAVSPRVRRLDNALSPRRAVRNVRRAVSDDVVAIVDEGTGVDASWRLAAGADTPVAVTYQGGSGSWTRTNARTSSASP